MPADRDGGSVASGAPTGGDVAAGGGPAPDGAPPARPGRALLVAGLAATALAGVALVVAAAATAGLTSADAVLLGIVEGLTEYLPVSSTGHLTVAQRLLDIGLTDDKAAADAYAVCIQAGAILAVLLLYRGRIARMARGVAGRDPAGRRLAWVVLVAFAPFAILGASVGSDLQERLFGVGPVVAAWAVGGLAILLLAPRVTGGARPLEDLGLRDAVIIGLAQTLALWPGVSRSLVVLLAAGALRLATPAAVELTFLLGLVTLGAATAYQALQDGGIIVEEFGIVAPVLGLAAAFASAVVAVRWMVDYLNRHGLALFGWYRLGLAAVVGGLLLTGAL